MWDRDPVLLFCMYFSSFPSISCRGHYPFLIECSWLPCWILVDCIRQDLILGSLFCSICLHVYFCAVLIALALFYSLKSGSMIPPALFFFLRITLAIQGLLWFHTNFTIVSSVSLKNNWYFDENCVESVDGFEQHGYLNSIVLPIHEHGVLKNLCLLWFLSAKSCSFFLF